MPIFLSIGHVVVELELPRLNMNTKQFSLYGTTLKARHTTICLQKLRVFPSSQSVEIHFQPSKACYRSTCHQKLKLFACNQFWQKYLFSHQIVLHFRLLKLCFHLKLKANHKDVCKGIRVGYSKTGCQLSVNVNLEGGTKIRSAFFFLAGHPGKFLHPQVINNEHSLIQG